MQRTSLITSQTGSYWYWCFTKTWHTHGEEVWLKKIKSSAEGMRENKEYTRERSSGVTGSRHRSPSITLYVG